MEKKKSRRQHRTIYFPDVEVLKEIADKAEKDKRGLGFIICECWINQQIGNDQEKRHVN